MTTTDFTGLLHIAGISVATQSSALAAQGQIDAYLVNVSAVTGNPQSAVIADSLIGERLTEDVGRS